MCLSGTHTKKWWLKIAEEIVCLSLLVHSLNQILHSKLTSAKPGGFCWIRVYHYQRSAVEGGSKKRKKKSGEVYLISRHYYKVKKNPLNPEIIWFLRNERKNRHKSS